MKSKLYSRRVFNKTLFSGLFSGILACYAIGGASAVAAVPKSEELMLDVHKDPSCGCCSGWIEHMEKNNFKTRIHHPRNLNAVKQELGIPSQLQSCHTSVSAEGFVFEGHIPARYVRQFLSAPPENALGLAVPGMPMGSPGMEMGGRFSPYNIVLLKKDGSSENFARVENGGQQ